LSSFCAWPSDQPRAIPAAPWWRCSDPDQPGIDLNRILSSSHLNPVNRTENLLRFLCHIAEQGGWTVNLNIRID
jgi:hypothetical protein